MSTDPDSDAPVDIRGYITDPKWVGYQVLTNYESTYWASLVGNDAWRLYEVLRSFCHQGNDTCYPSINLLIAILGKDRSVLIGRGKAKVVNGREYFYPGLIQILQDHNLVIATDNGEEGPKLRYTFHIHLSPGLLSPDQIAKLPKVLQTKHAQLVQRCEEEQKAFEEEKKALEAKKRPPKIRPNRQPDVPAPDDVGGIGNSNTPIGNSNTPSWNFQYKQHPITLPNKTTTGTRESSNNNSGGEGGDNQDVVVALVNEKISEKIAVRLAQRYNRTRIFEKIEYLTYIREQDPERVKKPQGWLRRAIEEDYAAPDGYQSPAERAAAEAEEQRRDEEMAQAIEDRRRREEERREQRRQQEAARLAALQAQYGTTQAELDLWQQVLQEFESSMPASTFQLSVANTVLLSLRDGQALIGLPNPLAREWVENRLGPKIRRTLASFLGGQKVTPSFVDLASAGAANGHTETASGADEAV
jgi:hypothetical protein